MIDSDKLFADYKAQLERATQQKAKAEQDYIAAKREHDIARAKRISFYVSEEGGGFPHNQAAEKALVDVVELRTEMDNKYLVFKIFKDIVKVETNREWEVAKYGH